MAIDTVKVLQILSRQQGEGQVLLDAISEVGQQADSIRKNKETVFQIVRALILLCKHGSESTKQAAVTCIHEHYQTEFDQIAKAVNRVQK